MPFLGSSAAALLAVVAAASASASVAGPPVNLPPGTNNVAVWVAAAAHRFAIPESWIYAVMRVESAGHLRAVSPKGAAGLMQIMPNTWTMLRARYGLGGDIFDPRDNIMAGTAFLRELYDLYGVPGFLAAYNAGPGRYENHLATGRPLPVETVAYVHKLAPLVTGIPADRVPVAAADPRVWTRAALFAGQSGITIDRGAEVFEPVSGRPTADRAARDIGAHPPVSAGLFVPLSGNASR